MKVYDGNNDNHFCSPLKCNIRFLKFALVLFGICSVILCSELCAQCQLQKDTSATFRDFDDGEAENFSIATFISNVLTPQIITDIKCIRAYIRNEHFQVLRDQSGDMRAIDAIYLKSLKMSDYNVARALFISFMAVLEHRKFDIKMPIFNSFSVPVSFEGDSVFGLRIKHLPSHVYSDTPYGSYGDRDKLQHFFGSAYLTYTSEAPEFVHMIGDFIEWGESKFIVGGANDWRDKRANRQGKSFGRDLLVVENLLPSDYLTFPHEERK